MPNRYDCTCHEISLCCEPCCIQGAIKYIIYSSLVVTACVSECLDSTVVANEIPKNHSEASYGVLKSGCTVHRASGSTVTVSSDLFLNFTGHDCILLKAHVQYGDSVPYEVWHSSTLHQFGVCVIASLRVLIRWSGNQGSKAVLLGLHSQL